MMLISKFSGAEEEWFALTFCESLETERLATSKRIVGIGCRAPAHTYRPRDGLSLLKYSTINHTLSDQDASSQRDLCNHLQLQTRSYG